MSGGRSLRRIHGVAVGSELSSDLGDVLPGDHAVDLEILLGEPVAHSDGPPPGRLLPDPGGAELPCTASENHSGYVLRMHDLCDILIDLHLRHATLHPFPGTDPEEFADAATDTVVAFVRSMLDAALEAVATQCPPVPGPALPGEVVPG